MHVDRGLCKHASCSSSGASEVNGDGCMRILFPKYDMPFNARLTETTVDQLRPHGSRFCEYIFVTRGSRESWESSNSPRKVTYRPEKPRIGGNQSDEERGAHAAVPEDGISAKTLHTK